MPLTSKEKELVLLAIKQLKSTIYNLINDTGSLSNTAKQELIASLVELASAKTKIASLEAESAPKQRQKIAAVKCRVLVADDEELTTTMITGILEDFGFKNLDVANNGQQAFDMIDANAGYHLVISDWIMPEKNGLDVLKHIKSKSPDCVFILLTAVSDDVLKSRATREGLDEYMVKPIEPDSLESILSQYFELTLTQ